MKLILLSVLCLMAINSTNADAMDILDLLVARSKDYLSPSQRDSVSKIADTVVEYSKRAVEEKYVERAQEYLKNNDGTEIVGGTHWGKNPQFIQKFTS